MSLTRVGHQQVAATLTDVARLGPFFATGLPNQGGPSDIAQTDQTDQTGDGWIAIRQLAEDRTYCRRLVDRVDAQLVDRLTVTDPTAAGEPLERRVVASIAFLGLAARLVAPSFGAAVIGRISVDLSPDQLWWRPAEAGLMPLLITATSGVTADDDQLLAEHLVGQLVTGIIAPVLETFAAEFVLSHKVLWGDVASAIGGAVASSGAFQTKRAQTMAGRLLGIAPLAGTVQPPPATNWQLRRRSCCLFYRVPGTGFCADCVLPRHRTS
jgi:ferric iron reductase protein FhuF